MSKLSGLLIGIFVVCAGYWAYPKYEEVSLDQNSEAFTPVPFETVQEESVEIPMTPEVILEPEENSIEKDLLPVAADKDPDIAVEGEYSDIKNWQVIWTPFRTKGSALGFASRISQVTGIETDVKKIKNGKFQVAFAFQNDKERQDRIQLIQDQICLTLVKGENI